MKNGSSTFYDLNKKILNVEEDLYVLEKSAELLEMQLLELTRAEKKEYEKYIEEYKKKVGNVKSENEYYGLKAEEDSVSFEYRYKVGIDLPRLYRGLYLIALTAAYESGVKELAEEIYQKKGMSIIKIEKCEGRFLDKAKIFFQQIEGFKIHEPNEVWQQIKKLFALRHIVAHANSRIAMIKKEKKSQVESWVEKEKCIEIIEGIVIIKSGTIEKLFDAVQKSLREIIKKFRELEDAEISL